MALPDAVDDSPRYCRCVASVRTLQWVLPSPGRVFSVVSRMHCSNWDVNTLGERLSWRRPVTAFKPSLADAARNASTVGRYAFNSSAIVELAAP